MKRIFLLLLFCSATVLAVSPPPGFKKSGTSLLSLYHDTLIMVNTSGDTVAKWYYDSDSSVYVLGGISGKPEIWFGDDGDSLKLDSTYFDSIVRTLGSGTGSGGLDEGELHTFLLHYLDSTSVSVPTADLATVADSAVVAASAGVSDSVGTISGIVDIDTLLRINGSYTMPSAAPDSAGMVITALTDSTAGWAASGAAGSTDSALVVQYAHVTDTADALRAEMADTAAAYGTSGVGDTADVLRAEMADTASAYGTAGVGDTADALRAEMADTAQAYGAAGLGDTADVLRAEMDDSAIVYAESRAGDTADIVRGEIGDTADVVRAEMPDTAALYGASHAGDTADILRAEMVDTAQAYSSIGLSDTAGAIRDDIRDTANALGFAPTASPTFTGAIDASGASLEIPNGANPTTDAAGELAHDSDDDLLETYSTIESESVVLPLHPSFQGTLFNPDNLTDSLPAYDVGELQWPGGIEIDSIQVTTSEDGAYALGFIAYSNADPPVLGEWIDTLNVGASDQKANSTTFTDANIEVGKTIYVSIPATDIDWVKFTVWFHGLGHD
jgi:hypothetical protein